MKKSNFISDDLVSLFKKLGFNERQIKKLLLIYNRYKENVDVLEESYLHYHDCMLKLGYDETIIHELASIYPKAMFQTFEKGTLETYYEKYIKYIVPKSCSFDAETKVEKNRKSLKTLGLSDDKIEYILSIELPFADMNPEELLDNIVFYLSQGITEEELVIAINNNATLLLYGKNEYLPLFELSIFTPDDFAKMVKQYTKNNSIVQADVMYKTLSWTLTKKIDYSRFVKYLRNHMIKNLDEEELEKAYQTLIAIGFSEEQANLAVSNNLSILYKRVEKFEYIINFAKRYGINRDKIIIILTGFSAVLDLSDEKIAEKIAIIARYNLTNFIVDNPKNLMQSAELIDARAAYLRLFYPEVKGKEFATDVFLDENIFLKKYNREKQYLKELRILLKR